VGAFIVALEDELLVVSSGGVVIRTDVRQISPQGRDATGVRLMNLDPGQVVASVTPVVSDGE
jgi:DNA gyrase subunit A